MTDPIARLTEYLENGSAAALATVVGPKGLAPRLLGRKLLVRPDGSFEGSLGVDTLDGRVAADCRGLFELPPHTRYFSISLSDDERGLLDSVTADAIEIFAEAMELPPTLLIVGAGHISQPLSRIAKMLDFRVVVLDDRPSFADPTRFPDADSVIAGYLDQELKRFPINHSTYVVLVTRGHTQDEESLRQIIGTEAAYIGMIGSKRRVSIVLQRMLQDGFEQQLVDRVCSPIGLDIGAETPTEIALSILGEVINVRRRGTRHEASLSSKHKSL